MARDPLAALLRLRRLALRSARRDLADRSAAESAARAHAEALDSAVAAETTSYGALPTESHNLEACAAWLAHMARAQAAAAEAARTAAVATAGARAAVNQARLDVRVLETALERREARQRMVEARTEQAALDEAAASRRRSVAE